MSAFNSALIRRISGEDEEDPALGSPMLPGGMPGTPGNPNTGIAGGQTSVAPSLPDLGAPPSAAAAPAHYNTKLMEGDAGKLADPSHAAKSPKYDFLQLAQQGTHDYNDLGGMLKELQGGANGGLWQGWTANGDKLKFGGDASQLDPSWNGVREVDAIGGLHNPNGPQGFRWGAEEPGAQGAQMNAGRPSFAGSTISPMLQGDAQGGIQQALAGMGAGNDSGYLQKLIAQLQQGGQQ